MEYRPWRAASGLRGTALHQFAPISPHILDQGVHITAVGRIVENVRPYGKPSLEFRARGIDPAFRLEFHDDLLVQGVETLLVGMQGRRRVTEAHDRKDRGRQKLKVV